MDNLHRLEEIFARFPGIGPRQAKRFVYYLLSRPPASVKEFTDLVSEVRRSSLECDLCHRFFAHAKAAADICPICSDKNRDRSLLMIVARDSDFESIEKSGAYKGLYFILGGTVPILDKEPEKRIRLRSMLERISSAGHVSTSAAASSFKEIILSLNTTPDGEHTADIVRDAINSLFKNNPHHASKVSVLGRGLSTGAELEYADSDTIRNALQNRH